MAIPRPVRRHTGALLLGLALAACSRGTPPAPAADDDTPKAPAIARIAPAAAQTVGIALAMAGPAEIRDTLPLYGVVRPNAEHVREVIARFPGTVKSVRKAIGDRVRAGETLATIESNESLQTYALTAPIAGVVTAREADPGEQAGTDVLFTIADPSTVWIELSLFPADAARVRSGQAVRIEGVGADLHGSGRIGLVGVFGSAAEPAPTARVVLANPDGRWTPGLFVDAAVELATRPVPVAVAASALQTLDGHRVVFVPVDGGYAPRTVRTGRADEARVEIVDGLAAGERYVAANSFVVKAELGRAALAAEDDDAPAPAAAAPAADPATRPEMPTAASPDRDEDAPPETPAGAPR